MIVLMYYQYIFMSLYAGKIALCLIFHSRLFIGDQTGTIIIVVFLKLIVITDININSESFG